MKELGKKIESECKQSKLLREKANANITRKGKETEKEFYGSMKLREEQQLHWDKFNFYKNLNRAIEKEK